jgi:hypothetical protein
MRSNSYHVPSKLFCGLFGATLFLSVGPAALRAIAQIDLVVAHISLELCEMGLAFLRACGI